VHVIQPDVPFRRAERNRAKARIAPPGVAALPFLVEGPTVVARHTGGRDERYGALAQRLRERREGDDPRFLPTGPGLHHHPYREVEEAVGVDRHPFSLDMQMPIGNAIALRC
jgi:hypothetical protein